MGVPKGKTSKANRRMNRAARYTSEAPALSVCPQCHALKQPHHACPECGYYKGRPVVVKKEKAE
ncbi:MAG: 50S ribosomal protein L32 [Firmicutes bacterium]|jgi:large subunit ribosomal protein L32|nr:50S ribosomal protein L32 [Bacillota bacterium]MBQ1343435.1 50S ribosomal protein L32 [Bacillota bacterium]MBQ3287571.1 50S ribosomal protein L32 [Bacillota bacterium]MBQ6537016.1 50S ribosomal protein L32 [Bacillota bacterium]MBQ6606965.1 50S ribosomal protein L32 [Bacillota bacterium]